MGDTVNIANRLETSAEPGTVVISESTRQLMRGAYQVRRLAPLTVKGKVSPLVAYLVEGQPVSRPPARYPGGSVFETRMVARDVEVVMV